jgi:DNA-binding NtrC family response regulator
VSGVAIDVTILDINLPGKDGIAAMEIASTVPLCRIQLMSGDSSSTEILEREQKDGIDFPVLAKPIPPEQLMSAILPCSRAENVRQSIVNHARTRKEGKRFHRHYIYTWR